MRSTGLLALAASLSVSSVSATIYKGFNYGATKADGTTSRDQSDFESLFKTAKNLVGTSGFTSARLYTTIQGGTTSDPTSAIPAAIAQDVSLLVTLWASGTAFSDELTALKSAISTYGSSFSDLVVGIAVGSEDLYRNSPTGIAAGSTVGAEPDVIVDYIKQVRSAISGTVLSGASVGHVDTWTAWVNSSNQNVIDNCDWIGVDAYPYYQSTMSNSIDNAATLFNDAMDETKAAVGSKPVWITETGWPVSGKTENLAVANTANAKTYWQDVGCPNFDVVNTWWYILEDTDNSATPNPSFGIAPGTPLSTTPLFDLSCSNTTSSSSSSSVKASSTASSKSSSATGANASTASSVSTSAKSGASSAVSSAKTASIIGTGSAATSTGNSTLLVSATPTTTSSGSSSTSTGAVANSNSAATLSGPVFGVMGALIAALVL